MDKITKEQLQKLIDFSIHAYQDHTITGEKYRQDGKVAYVFHPLWCASMLLMDTRIPYRERRVGYQALLLHDVLENTDLELPGWIDDEVKELVEELTFESWEEKKRACREKPIEIKLLLLVDNLSSLYEEHVSEAKRAHWKQVTLDVADDVEAHYGDIRLVHVARAVAEHTDW